MGRELGLGEVARIMFDGCDLGAAGVQSEGLKSGVATDVEHGLPPHVLRECRFYLGPEVEEEVAQRMVRRGAHPMQVEIVEPGAELIDSLA